MRHRCTPAILLAVAACALSCAAQPVNPPDREPVVGGSFEGSDAVFQGMPEKIAARTRIASEDEPGEPLRIIGTVKDKGGKPVPGIIVYAYHTDARGIYPANEKFAGLDAARHGTLRGWAKTDDKGRYRFDTIRPAGYPDTAIEQHVHMHILEPGRCTYWIESVVFDDDPRLTEDMRAEHKRARGGSGVVKPRRDADGVWIAERAITLGENVPGYLQRDADG